MIYTDGIKNYVIVEKYPNLGEILLGESDNPLKTRLCSIEEFQDNYTQCKNDEAENPIHYTKGGPEVRERIDNYLSYLPKNLPTIVYGYLFNVQKYLHRFPYKNDPVGDLKKARQYIDFVINRLEEEK